jgi:hypothetical protein
MGSDATLYVFDSERYTGEVVPAIRALLLNGELAPWLASIVRQHCGPEFNTGLFRGTDLLRYCTYLTPELAPQDVTAITEINPHFEEWSRRACWSKECPVRSTCTFHISATNNHDRRGVTEEVNRLVEAAIVSRCLHDPKSQSLFVGRMMSAADYVELLDRLHIPPNHSVRALLKKLATRGFVIGYRWGHSEGIHGWLDSTETRQLLDDLCGLPLPQYEPALETAQHMLQISQQESEAFRQDEGVTKRLVFRGKMGSSVRFGSYPPKDKDRVDELNRKWLLLSLSFVRTITAIAERQSMGILWGNDLPLRVLD